MLERRRLSRALDGDAAITVLQGAAGTGKTMVIDQWAEQTAARIARVSVPQRLSSAGFWWLVDAALSAAGLLGETPELGGQTPTAAQVAARLHAGAASGLVLVVEHPERVDADGLEAGLIELAVTVPELRLIVEVRDRGWFGDPADVGERRWIGPQALALTAAETAELITQVEPSLADRPELLAELHRLLGGNPLLTRAITPVLWQYDQDAGAAAAPDAVAAGAVAVAIDEAIRAMEGDVPHSAPMIAAAVAAAITGRLDGPVFAAVAGGESATLAAELARLAVAGRPAELAPLPRQVLLDRFARSVDPDVRAGGEQVLEQLRDRGDVPGAVRAAMTLRRWTELETMIRQHWHLLAVVDAELLRNAMLALPEHVADGEPWVKSARAMFRGAGAAAVGVRLTESGIVGRDDRALDPIDALGYGTVAAILARLDGRLEEAAGWVGPLRDLLGGADRSVRDRLGAAVHLLRLQWGLTLVPVGDSVGATELLTAAHDGAVAAGVGVVARAAAGAMALQTALDSDLESAHHWLARERDTRSAGPESEQARALGRMAEIVLAAATWDRAMLAGALTRARGIAEGPETWWLLEYGRACDALLGGHAEAGIDRLRRVMHRWARWAPTGTVPDRLLSRALVRLMIAAGRGNEAVAVLDRLGPDRVDAAVCRARVELLAGESGRAEALAEQALNDPAGLAPVQVQAGLVVAAAMVRSGRADQAVDAVHRAWRAAHDGGIAGAMLTMSASDRAALLGRDDLDPQVARMWREAADAEIFGGVVQMIALTPREKEMLALLATGLTPAGVSDRLGVSHNTVKSQLRTAYRKLDARSAEEAVATAHRLGVL